MGVDTHGTFRKELVQTVRCIVPVYRVDPVRGSDTHTHEWERVIITNRYYKDSILIEYGGVVPCITLIPYGGVIHTHHCEGYIHRCTMCALCVGE